MSDRTGADAACRLRVLYNATSAWVGGGRTYALHQIETLAGEEGLRLTVLCTPANHAEFVRLSNRLPRMDLRLVRVPNAGTRFLWEQLCLPVLARRYDVLLCPGNFLPLARATPTVLILQNANYVGLGRRLPQNRRMARRAKIAVSLLSMRRADLVVAVSYALGEEIRSEAMLSGVALEVIQSGAPAATAAAGPSGATGSDDVADLVGTDPYLLSVASDYPHKRLSDLAVLVPLLADQRSGVPRRIVFAGTVSEERRQELSALAHPFEDRLVFIGSVNERRLLVALTQGAAASVAPTELESWGLTLHEAGAVGCRLVVSDIPAHREVADGRATFFPVGDIPALLTAVTTSLAEPRARPWTGEWGWPDHGRQLVAALGRVAAGVGRSTVGQP